jgi:predicted RNA-binding protein with PUA-like domain
MAVRVPTSTRYFLAKTDPETYPIEQLEKDGKTVWDGVRNPTALRAIRVGRVEPPVTLREIKETGLFDDWSLVRQSRLSTMPAPPAFVAWMRKQRPAAGI